MGDLSLNIPLDLRTPGQYIEIDASRAVGGLPIPDRRILLMGQRLATGTVAAEVPTMITRAAQAETYFGRGSMLARMGAALFAGPGQYREVWAVALEDGAGGVAATWTVTVSTVSTGPGTLALWVAGTRLAVAVDTGQAVATTATALAAAINGQSDLPVTASAAAGVVTVTARHKGEVGNGIDLRIGYAVGEALPAGLTVVIAAGVAGTGNPSVTDALAAIAGEPFYTLVMPWTDATNLAALESELDSRWGPLEQRTGHGFAAVSGTHAALIALGDARNSPHLSLLGTAGSPSLPAEAAAAWAGVCEYYGSIDPARPLQSLALPGFLAPAVEQRFSRTERDLLLHHGISTVIYGADGVAYLERVITTYQETPGGVADTALLDLETKWTADYIRYAVRARIATRFPRHKLADDGTRFGPGQAIATPRLIRAELIALFRDLEEAGLVEDAAGFAEGLQVVRSGSDPNRVNALLPPNLVNQFRVFAAAVQFRL
ncbi:phage tail sheath subtilisin-like domain-containing protein [Lamprocystis purpurea]|jgi:phage tail sheath gpL-like|uniref:phage tail sheath subtilisin-like domain-containing protein n=1 Tax=Lamprocystis purpurea TaxID=61598 RepID=UPI000378128C|nr:phage tail sheath subtilisin-like domain-containing protein [Lamprocystis purpurea]